MRDSDIDDLFARAREAVPVPDTALMKRIEAQGLAVQSGFAAVPAAAVPKRGSLSRWLAALGGGPVVAGLATAALAGVWIGLAQPAPVAAVTSGVSAALGQDETSDFVELIPGFDSFASEG